MLQREIHCVSRLHHPAASYSSAYRDDFLLKSIIPTDHFQKSLPRLPVPELKKTCERYLNAQRPLLSDEQFKQTENIVSRFRDGDGRVPKTGYRATTRNVVSFRTNRSGSDACRSGRRCGSSVLKHRMTKTESCIRRFR
ncbi:hypothetical protein LSAT2_019362 [Lamellibrachia satsuma]|nr:hypothetical protein LSAT2_019362 [Lamellibrachia satsuma]